MAAFEQKALMHKMWRAAQKYQNLLDWAEKHLRPFGWKRYILFIRFSRINKRLANYKATRLLYVSMALGIARRMNREKREQRQRRMDN